MTMGEVARGNLSRILAWILTKITRESAKQAVWAISSVILALYVSAVIMQAAGIDPMLAFGALYTGAVSESERIFFFGSPLILTGLSVALAFRTGLFNIGAEGQVYIGSMAAALLGYLVALPIFIHPISCLIVGAIGGGLWGFVPGLLKAYRGAHEVVTTMMLSYTAILFMNWLSSDVFREPGEFQWVNQTPQIFESAELPLLFEAFGGEYLHAGIILSIGAVIVVAFFLKRTVMGFEMRAVGFNPEAAETAGINPKRNMALALAFSGALSGLAGASEIQGTYYRYIASWSPGLGWDGITVAVLGHNNPWGVLVAAMFFGFLRAGGNEMHQQAGVPLEMVTVIQGLVVLFVAAPRLIEWMANRGVGFAVAIRANPLRNVIYLVGMLYFGFGAVYGLGVAPTADPVVGAALALASPLCLIAFVAVMARKQRAPLYSLVASMGWLGAVIVSIMIGNFGFFGVTMGLAMVGLALVMFMFLIPRLIPSEGGEQS